MLSILQRSNRLDGYLEDSEPGCCHNLSQDSRSGHGISSSPDVLHTVIKHAAIHFFDEAVAD
eukprot:8825161-Karenia_brevis.AAC.1